MKKDKKKEKEKKTSKKVFIIITVVLCITAGVLAYLVYNGDLKLTKSGKAKTNNTKEVVTFANKEYLSGNYNMLMHQKTGNYVKKHKQKIEELKEKETITIDDSELISEVPAELGSCSGELKVTKQVNGIITYSYTSNCEKEKDSTTKVTMKFISNLNQNGQARIITNIKKTEDGYFGFLSDFVYEKETNEEGELASESMASDGVSGVVFMDNDFNIENMIILGLDKNNEEQINTSIYPLTDGYLVQRYHDTNNGLYVELYNETGKKTKTFELDYEVTGFLYDDNEKFVFASWGDILEFSKETGKLIQRIDRETDAIGEDTNEDGAYHALIRHQNGILYGVVHNMEKSGKAKVLRKYDLKGNLIAKITMPSGFENSAEEPFVNKDYVGIVLNNYINIIDNQGNIKNKIEYDKDSYHSLKEIGFYEKDYMVLDEVQKKADGEPDNIYRIMSYDYNHKLLDKKELNKDYAMNTLKETGYDFTDIMDDINIIGDNLIELMYSSDDNGTEAIIIYE